MRRTPKSGFTLIELSIVLVIIGLLVGGVLVGRDLIEAANVRKDMMTIEQYNGAVNAFQLKYDDLPGDMPNAAQFGFDAEAYGDGNGRIQGVILSYSTLYFWSPWNGLRPEWLYVGHHLGRAGLVELSGDYAFTMGNAVPGVAYPKMYSHQGGVAWETVQGSPPGILVSYEENNRVSAHFFRMGACIYGDAPSYLAFNCGFTPAKAQQFDHKFDDGQALSGIIQIGPLADQCPNDVFDTSFSGCQQGGVNPPGQHMRCAITTTQNYDSTYSGRTCSLRVKASF